MDKCIQDHRWHLTYFLISFHLVPIIFCLEEGAPAIFLSPRNFNPHPYVATFHSRNSPGADLNTGPVLFPQSSSDDENNEIDPNRVNNYYERERIFHHPIDYHPYSKVAKRNRYLVRGRFRNEVQENRINPKIFEGLSKYATKVLSRSPSQLGKDYTLSSLSNNDTNNNYAFSYKVVDYVSGDDFSHTQTQNSRATNGEYKVKLPDGRVQTVSYVADKNGYKADVKYTENDFTSQDGQIPHAPPRIHHIGNSRQRLRPSPIPKTISHDYQYGHTAAAVEDDAFLPGYDSKSILLAPLPTQPSQISIQYDYHDTFPYGKSADLHSPPANRQPNVEIFVNNRDISRDREYVFSTTAAPYFFSTTPQPYYVESATSSAASPHHHINFSI